MDRTIEIKNDVLDVVRRIKGIDRSYYVLYNLTKKKFEVHSSKNRGNTLAVTLPFCKLDARAVEYVRKTRIERINEIAAEIEIANIKAEIDNEKKVKERVLEALYGN